jgi:hypothetical protein
MTNLQIITKNVLFIFIKKEQKEEPNRVYNRILKLLEEGKFVPCEKEQIEKKYISDMA